MGQTSKGFFYWFTSIFGIISGIAGFYFYFVSQRERIPTFIVDKIRTTIVDRSLIQGRPINMTDSNGRPINDDVSIITFYFFNNGDEPIRRENVLTPIRIVLASGATRILDYKILASSREVIGAQLSINDSTTTSIDVDFRILEKNDGFTGQVVFVGNKHAELRAEGIIEGVKTFNSAYRGPGWVRIVITVTVYLMLIFLIVGGGVYIFFRKAKRPPVIKKRKTLSDRFDTRYELIVRNPENLTEKTTLSFTYAAVMVYSALTFVVLFTVSLFLAQTLLEKWFDPRYKPKTEVPSEILPNSLAND